MHLDYLTDKLVFTYMHHIEHIGFLHALGNNERSRNLYDPSFNHTVMSKPFRPGIAPAVRRRNTAVTVL